MTQEIRKKTTEELKKMYEELSRRWDLSVQSELYQINKVLRERGEW